MGISERRKYKATAPFTRTVSRPVVINGLRFVWVVALVWGELGIYFWSLSSCKWPEITSSAPGAKPTHVLLISDPQVGHPSERRSSWTKSLGQFLYELNLKRSWHVTRRLNAHEVFFLGDMLSSGKYVKSESEYRAYWRKFQSIFKSDASFTQHYLPGNNDVGMGVSHASPKSVRRYYSNVVGPFNRQVIVRDHVFICIDAPGLVDEDYQRSASGAPYSQWQPIRNGPVEFVKSASTGGRRTILLSHIPLARPDTASCGPSREKGSIRRGVGHGYQNTLGKQTTSFLLQTLRPAAVFSGDNRDFCEYSHPVEAPDREAEERAVPIREITVKSFSMSNHIRRPGFQLLSLIDPTPMDHSFVDAPCLLPDPYRVYSAFYAPLAFLTLLCLFVFNTYRSRRLRTIVVPPPMSLSPHSTPGAYTPLHPGPDVWSPYTPPVPVSPRSTLPPSLRTPNALAGPTMRAASRPATPLASPLLGPPSFHHTHHGHHEDEDEDSLYPAQYAIHRNGHVSDGEGEEWPTRSSSDPASSYFLPGLNAKPPSGPGWAWSWNFVFRGRRRRMTVSVPTWGSVRELAVQLAPGADSDMVLRRRGVAWSTLRDGLGILWPTLLVWTMCAWWMF